MGKPIDFLKKIKSDKMKIIYFLVIILMAIFFIVGLAYAAEKKPLSSGETGAIKIKPDIIITDLQIYSVVSTRIEESGLNHSVRITVDLTNTARGSSTGPFNVKVEWTEDPTVSWNYLNSGSVANLINDPSKISPPKATLYFDHKAPIGKAYKYRITADYLNRVDEAREDNNAAIGTLRIKPAGNRPQ